jgi:hypothetical protein
MVAVAAAAAAAERNSCICFSVLLVQLKKEKGRYSE